MMELELTQSESMDRVTENGHWREPAICELLRELRRWDALRSERVRDVRGYQSEVPRVRIVQRAADGQLIEREVLMRDKQSAYYVNGHICFWCHRDNTARDHARGCPSRPEPTYEEMASLKSALAAAYRG